MRVICVLFTVSFILIALVMGLLSCGGECELKEPVTVCESSVDSVLSADSVMIVYEVQGDANRALVLVHGWCCDRGYWSNQIDFLSKKYRVVTIDLAGHGESGDGRSEWSMESFGADVAAVVGKLDLNDVILVGHSMGGRVNLEAARLLPGKVKAIVGVDNYQDFAQKASPEQMDALLSPFKAHFQMTTDQFVRGLFAPTSDSALVERVATDMSSAPEEIGVRAMAAYWSYDAVATLREVRLPIRVIVSDVYEVKKESNQQVAESFESTVMTDVGHFIQMEKPDEFNRLLSETIQEFWPEEQI